MLSAILTSQYDQKHNPHRQQIFIIGAAGEAGKFEVVPLNKVTAPTPDQKACRETTVDTTYRSNARCKYDGVVFETPYTDSFRSVFPVFAKAITLHR